jgi:manganese/iron transport system permease protein
MMSELLAPFHYEFMIRAMLAAGVVGGMAALLSCFVVLKGWSLIGDALAHAVVPGVAIAYWLGMPFSIGAFFSGLLAAGSMAFLRSLTTLKPDAVIGLVFTTFFAGGLALISLRPTGIDVQTILMGDILTVSDGDFWQIGIICALVALVLLIGWKDLAAVFFDEIHARSIGLPTRFWQILFFVLLSATIVASLQAVGAVLVIAMVITPGATALLLTDRFGRMLILAMLFGAGTGVFGTYLSFFADGATGGLIVCLQTSLFLLVYLFAPKHGRFALLRGETRVAAP